MSKIKIAVLMASHNRKQTTLYCLNMLFSQASLTSELELKVFLVDDGSTDNTRDAVLTNFPEVILIRGNGNLFWNGGMRLAWEHAVDQGGNWNYFLWLNDDTFLHQGILSKLTDWIRVNDNNIYVGATESVDKREITYSGYNKENQLILPNGGLQVCQFFNGNFVLIPWAVYVKLGNLSPAYSHALGDFDYGLRAMKQGIRSLVLPEIVGFCDLHNYVPKWRNPEIDVYSRFRALYSPVSGCIPVEMFKFQRTHYGLYKAFCVFFSNHLRAAFPSLSIK